MSQEDHVLIERRRVHEEKYHIPQSSGGLQGASGEHASPTAPATGWYTNTKTAKTIPATCGRTLNMIKTTTMGLEYLIGGACYMVHRPILMS